MHMWQPGKYGAYVGVDMLQISSVTGFSISVFKIIVIFFVKVPD